jgi:hypothetical protein
MKITLGKATNLFDLKSLFNKSPMSFSTAYQLNKLFSALEKESNFYKENLRKIIDEYAEKDSEGNPVQTEEGLKIREDSIQEVNDKLNELLNIEVEVPDIFIEMKALENVNITLDQLNLLSPFIKE